MSNPTPLLRPTPIDTALRERARRVTPGGMTGHLNAAYARRSARRQITSPPRTPFLSIW